MGGIGYARAVAAGSKLASSIAAILLLATPVAATARAAKVWRIAFLTHEFGEDANPSWAVFRQRLRELGYVEWA